MHEIRDAERHFIPGVPSSISCYQKGFSSNIREDFTTLKVQQNRRDSAPLIIRPDH